MARRGHQDDAFSVRKSAAGEPADSATEKVLVLIELHDMIAWAGGRQQAVPGLRFAHTVRLTVKIGEHRIGLHSSRIVIWKFRIEPRVLLDEIHGAQAPFPADESGI